MGRLAESVPRAVLYQCNPSLTPYYSILQILCRTHLDFMLRYSAEQVEPPKQLLNSGGRNEKRDISSSPGAKCGRSTPGGQTQNVGQKAIKSTFDYERISRCAVFCREPGLEVFRVQ